MKKIIISLFFIVSLTSFLCNKSTAQTESNTYDSVLAKQYGADDYGMKMYVMVILKTGAATNVSSKARDSIFAGHMKNINRLAKEGKLLIAGPFEDNSQNYSGIFIFNVSTIEEGKQLVATDPAVQAHVFDCDFFLWYGSSALMQVPATHSRLQKKKF